MPMQPKINVISNWAILQIKVTAMDEIFLSSSRCTILPKYSPTLFGVKKASEVPDNIALEACRKDISAMLFIDSCHLRASIPQLTNIKRKTVINPDIERPSIRAI